MRLYAGAGMGRGEQFSLPLSPFPLSPFPLSSFLYTLLLVGMLAVVTGCGPAPEHRPLTPRESAYEARVDSLIDYYAGQIDAADRARGSYFHVAARLYRGQDLDWVLARLDTLMADPRGDMFWMYPFTLVTYLGRDRLPEATRARMRDLWRTYTPYRGDTENHWAMYYTSLYLITQRYPGEPGEQWFNGKSSTENFDEARDYLLHWMDVTTTIGQGEFDSPWYMGMYVAALSELYAWADDPEMKLRAGMMLDYLFADFAAESLNGLYVGGFSRIYEDRLFERRGNISTGVAWLLFGNTPFMPRAEAMILAMSGYRLPEVLHRIATDRSRPYVHRERKRTRDRIRYRTPPNAPVYKYTYMHEAYAVASMQGGLLQPIQQHTWEVFWAEDNPGINGSLLFTLHPYSDSHELAMYFPEEPELLTEAVTRSKNTYDSWDKWTGGSPFEQVFQHEDAVIALYDIPPGTRFPHIDGFFSGTLEGFVEDPSGWLFMQGGKAFIAYYPLAPYTWMDLDGGGRRLHSTALKNGAVVQVAPAAGFASFDAFQAAVRALPLETETMPTPHVRFTTLRGTALAAAYGETPSVDGVPVDYAGWPLFEGPFLVAEQGSRVLEMRHGDLRRILDFNTPSVTDRPE